MVSLSNALLYALYHRASEMIRILLFIRRTKDFDCTWCNFYRYICISLLYVY